jgi:hypothetical protein
MDIDWRKFIHSDPEILSGKPYLFLGTPYLIIEERLLHKYSSILRTIFLRTGLTILKYIVYPDIPQRDFGFFLET